MNTALLNQISKAKTKSLFFSTAFLFSSSARPGWWFLLANGLLVGLFLKFFNDYDFKFDGSENKLTELTTLGIYTFIFGLAIYGMCQILYSLAKLHIESANALSIFRSADGVLKEVRAKTRTRIEIEELEKMLPDNPDKTIAMLRLARHIISDAKDRKFDSPATIMQPYREESARALFKVATLQKTVLQLGITGTFIGLITAFLGLDAQNVDSSQLAAEIIPALKYAFITSIAGLISAIILGLFILLFRKTQDRFFQDMEHATQSLISLARNSINKDDFVNEFGQMNYALGQVENRIYGLNREVEYQTKTMTKGLEKLNEVKQEFYSFLGRLSDEERSFLGEIRSYHQDISPQQIGTSLKESIEKSVEVMNIAMQNNVKQGMSKYDSLNGSLEKTSGIIEKLGGTLTEQHKQLVDANSMVKNVGKEFQHSMLQITASQEAFVEKITGAHLGTRIREDMVKASSDVSKSISSELNQLQKDMNGFKEELAVFNKNAGSYFKQRSALESIIVKTIATLAGIAVSALLVKLLFF